MNVALIGASGNVGSRILAELACRGHAVTAIARDPTRVPVLPDVVAKGGDVADQPRLAALLAGHDAVISAVPFATTDAAARDLPCDMRATTISAVPFATTDAAGLIATVRSAHVPRYLVVGGAGSLEVAPGNSPLGTRLIDTPDFPDAYKPEATAGCVFLDLLRVEKQLDWTFLSPSAMFIPGKRTGKFRLGADQLLSNENGSSISFEDYAVALVDELEKPSHSRARFTVGY